MWVYIWLAVVCVSALLEAFTMQMVSIWFVGGGIIALILAACQVSVEIQVIVFVAVSLLSMLALRNLCMKFLLRKDHLKTNVDAFAGKETKLLKDINLDEPGEIKFQDIIWTAITEKCDKVLKKGSIVRVLRVDGNKMIVEPIEQKSTNQQSKDDEQVKTEINNQIQTEEKIEEKTKDFEIKQTKKVNKTTKKQTTNKE